jgi:hypothetical protein
MHDHGWKALFCGYRSTREFFTHFRATSLEVMRRGSLGQNVAHDSNRSFVIKGDIENNTPNPLRRRESERHWDVEGRNDFG